MNQRNDVLLFDLGGVLVDVSPVEHMFTSLSLPVEEAPWARWTTMEFWAHFETNQIDAAAFSERFISEFALELESERLLAIFEAWNRGMLPGAVETLTALRQQGHRLAVLSNTNEVHARRLIGECAIDTLVDTVFFSHLIGMRKPDEAVYRHVAAELDVALEDLVFFDDNADNIAAARSLGMRAWLVKGVPALRERLSALGYL